ncbi:DUF4410 domain-containing protein [Brytella acorum]|uniref:DUF4410 domain-containing protein n=1 Tax=Brytella acorum TaxID=2959299 RepID=A0AA35Y011_9PROT|nr:DUF4410 domain-containing protein [Brytella acorum]MDF3625977.1 DUF4410 domain-containing protein [Brytella acorum]CAI9119204.1 DUF4410 domain-containing protein [Brytella acorum]
MKSVFAFPAAITRQAFVFLHGGAQPKSAPLGDARCGRFLLLGLVLLLASCAGAQVRNPVAVTDAQSVAPIAVTVKTSLPRTAQNATRLDRNMQALATGLATRLEHSQIAAHPADAMPQTNGAELALVVDLGTLDAGNPWSRELVGFGAGKSCLQTHVILYDERGAKMTTLLDFTVVADSGAMPGVIVSAWNPIGFGIHSAHAISKELRSDGHEDADRTAMTIVGKITEYYRTNGWLPPDQPYEETVRGANHAFLLSRGENQRLR